MKKNDYQPKPIDTSDVIIPEYLNALVEKMSRNTHEIWAETRIAQGWSYGKERNDTLKTHPCLVDYDALPESEKEYDHNTSSGVLKLILKLGFTIENSKG